MLPTDPHLPKGVYVLKLVGNARVQDWRWRFGADDDAQAIAMSVEQLSIVGDCKWVTSALLMCMEPEGQVLVPRDVYRFDVAQRVVVMEAQ